MDENTTSTVAEVFWNKVLGDWSNEAAHQAFIECCRANGQLADAASHYRNHRAELGGELDEQTAAQIEQRLKAIRSLALADLLATRTENTPHRRWRLFLSLAAVALFIAALLVLLRGLTS